MSTYTDRQCCENTEYDEKSVPKERFSIRHFIEVINLGLQTLRLPVIHFKYFILRACSKDSTKKSRVPIIVGVMAMTALTVGLCTGLWPCEEGFSGHGLLNCEDIDECKVGFPGQSFRKNFPLYIQVPSLLVNNCKSHL